MNNKLTISIGLIASLATGLVIGWESSKIKNGYFSKKIDEKEYAYLYGKLSLIHDVRSIGTPFIKCENSQIKIKFEDNQEIIIYDGERVFQENYPRVEDVVVRNGYIIWNDNRYEYTLSCLPMKYKSQEDAKLK